VLNKGDEWLQIVGELCFWNFSQFLNTKVLPEYCFSNLQSELSERVNEQNEQSLGRQHERNLPTSAAKALLSFRSTSSVKTLRPFLNTPFNMVRTRPC
jgi:hypothetical protein